MTLPEKTNSELQAEVEMFMLFIESCRQTGQRFRSLRLFANAAGFSRFPSFYGPVFSDVRAQARTLLNKPQQPYKPETKL